MFLSSCTVLRNARQKVRKQRPHFRIGITAQTIDHALRVPLYRPHRERIVRDRLNHAVRIADRRDMQPRTERADRLMMIAVDRHGLTEQRAQPAILRCDDGMDCIFMHIGGGEVLKQCPAEKDIDDLKPAADAEHRLFARTELPQQLPFALIAPLVYTRVLARHMPPIIRRMDVPTAGQQQRIRTVCQRFHAAKAAVQQHNAAKARE